MEPKTLRAIDVNSPEVLKMIQCYRVGNISLEISRLLGITPTQALRLFCGSQTYIDFKNEQTGLMHYSDIYVADEFLLEIRGERKLNIFPWN